MNEGLTEILVLAIAAAAFSGCCFLIWCLVVLIKRWIRSTRRRRSYHRVQTIANFSNETEFAYRPLDRLRREIRLLRILPISSSSEVEPEIKCELIHVILDDPALKYEALSYVWGKSPSRSTIQLDGTPFTVGRNLHAALRALRLQDQERIIWIDAVCIDQSNLTERSEQVLLMRDIYTNAQNGVVVYLDETMPEVENALLFLEQAQHHKDPGTWMKSTIGLDEHKKSWVGMSQLLNNDYWTRIWIVQELACAQSISVLCGHCSIDWNLLVAADSSWTENSLVKPDMSEWSIEEPVQKRRNGFRYVAADIVLGFLAHGMRSPPENIPGLRFWKISVGPKFFETTRASRGNPAAQKSLLDLMCLHESSQATDPRDKIYGLVGIGVDTQNTNFEINYRISQYDVANYFANFMISSTQSLDFLCFPMICLPPFTPSMSYHRYKTQTGNFFRTMGTAVTSQNGIELRKYTAAGSTRPEAQLIPRNKTAYTILGDGFWMFDTIIRTNLNRMKIEGVPVDEVAAFLDDLTESWATFQPWFRPLTYIPLVNKISPLMHILSIIALLLTYILMVVLYIIGFFIVLFCFMGGVQFPEFDIPSSPGRYLIRFQSLRFTAIDPTYRQSPRGSSDWIGEPHLVKLLNDIKRYLYFALKSSAPSHISPGTQMSKEERIASLLRTLIGNRTQQGTLPPAEWNTMFNVIINGPSFVPDDCMAHAPTHESPTPDGHVSTSSDTGSDPLDTSVTPQLTADQRAQAYVQPLIESIWHSLHKRKIFVTREGHLGLADVEAENGDLISVFLGCGFPVVLRSGWLSRWGWKNGRGVLGRMGRDGKYEKVVKRKRIVRTVMHGAAYLDGFMEGKAIEELDNGLRELVDFQLH